MTKTKAKGAGGKLSRSEIIQARLSPRLRFAAELIARQQRRTLSSLIEILIEDAANQTQIIQHGEGDPKNVSVMQAVNALWRYEEPKRLVALGLQSPELLNPDEERVLRRITNNLYFWRCFKFLLCDKNDLVLLERWEPMLTLNGLMENHLEEYWEKLNSDDFTPDDLPSRSEAGGILEGQPGKPKIFRMRIDADVSKLDQQGREAVLKEHLQKMSDTVNA